MKKLLGLLLMFAVCLNSFGRQAAKNDVILKVTGEELTGKVLKITDNEIEFAYAGETLSYTIKKTEILKITYGSGRIEVFSKPPAQGQASQPASGTAKATASNLEEHHNKVAILPFTFIRDGQPAADGINEEVQNETFNMLSKHAGIFTILNPRTTNAQLIKAGVTKDNIKGYTMDDLCNILGVEYVVDCLITMNKTTQTTYQSNSGQVKTKDNDKNDSRDKKYNSSSYGTATQNFETNLTLSIYNDKGNSLYSQPRKSFWNTQDAYKNTLEYLLKRSPLYSK